MTIQRIVNSFFTSCTYILNVGEHSVWLVDCGDVPPILSRIGKKLVAGVLLTHAHFDHIYGLNALLERYPNCLVYTNHAGCEGLLNVRMNLSRYHEMPFVIKYPERVHIINDRESINLTNQIKAKAIFTPGHNPSCITWLVGKNSIFTGDAFIPQVKTVTNLPFGCKNQAHIFEALIKELSSNRTLYPGHYVKDFNHD